MKYRLKITLPKVQNYKEVYGIWGSEEEIAKGIKFLKRLYIQESYLEIETSKYDLTIIPIEVFRNSIVEVQSLKDEDFIELERKN